MEYFDTSALAPLFVRDVHSAAIRHHVRRSGARLATSPLCRIELSSVLSRNLRMGLIDSQAALGSLQMADRWFETDGELRAVEPADWAVADRIVRRFELRLLAPDALHIAICVRDALTLVTFDRVQAEAARCCDLNVIVPTEPAL